MITYPILSYLEIIGAIDKLCNELSINPEKTLLNGLEIGLNISLPYPPDKFLNELIVWHKAEPLKWKSKNEYYIQFSRSQLTLKIYSKSKQFNLKGNLLRYELRIDKMEYAQKFDISTLADLMELDKLNILSNELIRSFDDLIYYDSTIDTENLKTTEKTLLEKGNNIRYWSTSNLHRSTLNRNKLKFQSLVRNHGKQNFHLIKNILIEKRNDLLKNLQRFDRLENDVKNKNLQRIDTLNSVSFCKCIVTGITKRSKGKYLTPIDIKYYFENDKKTYQILFENFLSTSYKNIDYSKEILSKQWIELCHRIRSIDYNERNNTKNNTRRSINRLLSEPTQSLFNQFDLISDSKKQLAELN